MTDAENIQPDEADVQDPDGYTTADLTPKDSMLNLMLTLFHGPRDQHRDGAFGLTLQSNGVVVSGIAISRLVWQDALLDSLEKSGTNHIPLLREVVTRKEDELATKWEAREEAGFNGGRRNFVHMRDVKLVGLNIDLPLWRGKLEDVTGWSMGSWNPAGSAAPQTAPSSDD